MVRDKPIRLSEAEHRRLSEYRTDRFGTDEVPFGAVIADLLDRVEAVESADESQDADTESDGPEIGR